MDAQIGAAEINITPAPGLPMDGYLARVHLNQGVHDPLCAQVLILECNEQTLVLITLDILAVSAPFTRQIQQLVAGQVSTHPDQVMVCASHTHAGPAGLQTWFPITELPATNPELSSELLDRISQALRSAQSRMAPARLSCAAAPITGIGMDRNQPRPAPDSMVTVLRFDRMDGIPAAVIFHYACHPTVLGPQLLYSADFPGAARDRVRSLYPDTLCLYLNGAAGNISTRFTRRSQTFEEVQRLGSQLGDHVIRLMQIGESMPWRLKTSHAEVDLPLRPFSLSSRTVQLTGNQRIDQTRAEGALLETQLARVFAGRTAQRATLQAFQIGSWWLLGVPGEPFNELAERLRRVSAQALVVGYANDYIGYFPTGQAVDSATYEALSSPYGADALDLIETALAGLIA